MLLQWQQGLERRAARKPRNVDWDTAEQIVQAVLAELQQVGTVEELRRRYARGNFWALQIARRLAPADLRLHDLHVTADPAYGLRYLELTGEPGPAGEAR